MSMEKFVYKLSLRLGREGYWLLWSIPSNSNGVKLIINHFDHIFERYFPNIEIMLRYETDTLDLFINLVVNKIDNYFKEIE